MVTAKSFLILDLSLLVSKVCAYLRIEISESTIKANKPLNITRSVFACFSVALLAFNNQIECIVSKSCI